jgi:uncharacterized protein (TIGR03086 family)
MNATSLQRSCDATELIVAAVRADQFGLPTPCSEWDVRALINHLLGTFALGPALLGGPALDMELRPGGLPPIDLAGDDPLKAYRTHAEHLLDAVRTDDLDRVRPTPLGEAPGSRVLGFVTLDAFVHGWDLAKATGQRPEFAPDLTAEMLEFAHENVGEGVRGTIIGPEVTVAADAPAIDRLVAYLGRTP